MEANGEWEKLFMESMEEPVWKLAENGKNCLWDLLGMSILEVQE